MLSYYSQVAFRRTSDLKRPARNWKKLSRIGIKKAKPISLNFFLKWRSFLQKGEIARLPSPGSVVWQEKRTYKQTISVRTSSKRAFPENKNIQASLWFRVFFRNASLLYTKSAEKSRSLLWSWVFFSYPVPGSGKTARQVGEYVTCSVKYGLACVNKRQKDQRCHDYRVRYHCLCCKCQTQWLHLCDNTHFS